MSYGFTNFTWIWLCLNRDEHLTEWTVLILAWWVCCPLLAQTFAPSAAPIVIQRTTGSYHGYMAAILFIGYLGVICFNLTQPEKGMPHSHSAAADNRHSCPVGLGEHSASGRHPQRRLFGCKKAQILVKKIASRKLVLYNEE